METQLTKSAPVQTKKWYQHSGVITIIVLALLAGVSIYFYLKTDKPREVSLLAQTVPADWIPFSAEGWQIKHPPDYEYYGKKLLNTYIFKNKATDSRLTVVSKDLNSVPEIELIKSIQEKYKLDIPETLIKIQVMGAEQFNHDNDNESIDVLINRIVYINNLKGAQFAQKDTSSVFPSGSISVKTSFEKNGRLVDLVTFPKSIDPNSSEMQTYAKFLSSFQFQ